MRKRLLGLLSAIAAIAVTATGSTAWRIYAYAGLSTPLRADAAIVLGAAAWGSEPSPVFRERIRHAVQLYHSAQVERLIFTGGQGDASEPAEAIVAQQYALRWGVPPADILVETQSRTTEQNLIYALQVAGENYLDTFLLVSDPLHMKRAMLIAQDLGMHVRPSPTPTTMYRTRTAKARMLLRETRLYLSYIWRRPYTGHWTL